VTCYCGKPFAGRPMIECSKCLTWVHLKCAGLRKTNIPDTWHCTKCKPKIQANASTAKSEDQKQVSGSRKRKSTKQIGPTSVAAAVAKAEAEAAARAAKKHPTSTSALMGTTSSSKTSAISKKIDVESVDES